MTNLEKKKLSIYREKYGEMTVDQLLQLAIEADQMATDCGAFDIAFTYMARSSQAMLNYAELLIKENQDASDADSRIG